jgi:hypothetical protein
MKIYGISGLGADKRVFERLNLDHEITVLDWLVPYPKESLLDYSKRMAELINTQEPFCLIGVSFGGIIASTIQRLLNPELTFIISSATNHHAYPLVYSIPRMLPVLFYLPAYFFRPIKPLVRALFKTRDKALLYPILTDTNPEFVRWAIWALVNFENNGPRNPGSIVIHGDRDLLFPIRKQKADYTIQGGHFIIVDQAERVSAIINDRIKSHLGS